MKNAPACMNFRQSLRCLKETIRVIAATKGASDGERQTPDFNAPPRYCGEQRFVLEQRSPITATP